MTRWYWFLPLLLSLGACSAPKPGGAGCAPYDRPFLGSWFDHYDRALHYSECAWQHGDTGEASRYWWLKAKDDLEAALRLRSVDQWRARAYGVRFVHYFPNRELGVVLYRLGDAALAMRSLDTSLQQADSARAWRFRGLAGRALYAEKSPPGAMPLLSVSGGSEVTRQPAVSLKVTARSQTKGIGLAQVAVAVNGKNEPLRYPTEGDTGQIAFSKRISLAPGKTRVLVTATDIAGRVTQVERQLYRDVTPPSLIFMGRHPLRTSGTGMRLVGDVRDETAVASVALNGTTIWAARPAAVVPLNVSLTGFSPPYRLRLCDGLKNCLEAPVELGNEDVEEAVLDLRLRSVELLASRGPLRLAGLFSDPRSMGALFAGATFFDGDSRLAMGGRSFQGGGKTGGKPCPEFGVWPQWEMREPNLSGGKGEAQFVVCGEGEVCSTYAEQLPLILSFAGWQRQTDTEGFTISLAAGGQMNTWLRALPRHVWSEIFQENVLLEPGLNQIQIEASPVPGCPTRFSYSLKIDRRLPKAREPKQRLKIAFRSYVTDENNGSRREETLVAEAMRYAMVNDGRFQWATDAGDARFEADVEIQPEWVSVRGNVFDPRRPDSSSKMVVHLDELIPPNAVEGDADVRNKLVQWLLAAMKGLFPLIGGQVGGDPWECEDKKGKCLELDMEEGAFPTWLALLLYNEPVFPGASDRDEVLGETLVEKRLNSWIWRARLPQAIPADQVTKNTKVIAK